MIFLMILLMTLLKNGLGMGRQTPLRLVLLVTGLCLSFTGVSRAESEVADPMADTAPTMEAMDPVVERLQALQHMRMRLEQDMADYLASAQQNSNYQPVAPRNDAPDLRLMRQDMVANLARMEERFRCLDVDLTGNNGNVVLVCGDNHGPVSTNNQQAFGADLNVSGGGL